MHNLKNLFIKHIDAGLYPGVEWKIIHQNNVFEGRLGYLNLSAKKSLDANSIYRIWSMTKPVISVVILQLIDEKKIKLDDIIIEYLQIENLRSPSNYEI